MDAQNIVVAPRRDPVPPSRNRVVSRWFTMAMGRTKSGSKDFPLVFARLTRWSRGEAAISTEVELKLDARSEDLPALKRALIAMARVSAQERLISTYYDTPGSVLKERG